MATIYRNCSLMQVLKIIELIILKSMQAAASSTLQYRAYGSIMPCGDG